MRYVNKAEAQQATSCELYRIKQLNEPYNDLVKARISGIHPFCITIDTQGRDYLPHMYGAAYYVVVDEVGKLPLKVANIYRRLTT